MSSSSSSTEAKKLREAGLLAKVKSPQLHNWLLIIVIGLVVLWLSIEAIPLACLRLMQMLGDWNILQAASGNAIFAPFALLLLQVLCFLAAWVIFVLVIVREVLAFNNGSDLEQSVTTPPAQPDIAEAVVPVQTASVDEYTPFDMDSAIFELLPDQDEAEPVEAEEESLASTAAEEQESVFVYGDPLEGDLPEIFSYDTDLMRDVQDLREKKHVQAQADSGDVEEELDTNRNSDKEVATQANSDDHSQVEGGGKKAQSIKMKSYE
jgi:hypothetical protein